MNTIVKIFLYLVKVIVFWVIEIPSKLNIFATFMYFGLMYLCFGTASMSDIKHGVFEDNWYAQALVFIFFGAPALIGFFCFLGLSIGSSDAMGSIDSVIAYRNQKMKHASPKEAYEIMKKTAHLDVVKSDPSFDNARAGFRNTTRNAGPSSVYKDLMDK